jgi:hypothetical protein
MMESVVLCEGYHDRAFWAGWLDALQCADLSRRGRSDFPVPVIDPWGKPVQRGEFGFESSTGRFVRIVPCRGDSRLVRREARRRLRIEMQRRDEGAEPRLARLVLNVDPDVPTDVPSTKTGLRPEDVRTLIHEFDPAAAENDVGDLVLFGGTSVASLVRWETGDAPTPGLPSQQTLERLVCAAIVAAYAQRGPAVQQWLDSRPDPPPPDPKEHAWSYMAGWYAEHGCEDFFRHVWRDEAIRTQLESRLKESRAWRIAEALAE